MDKNFKAYILLCTLLSAGFLATVVESFLRNADSSLWLFALGYLIFLELFTILAHQFSGTPLRFSTFVRLSTNDLNHKQLALLNKYLSVGYGIYTIVGLFYVALFQRDHWDSIIFIVVPPLVVLLSFIIIRRTIKGVPKEEIFQ